MRAWTMSPWSRSVRSNSHWEGGTRDSGGWKKAWHKERSGCYILVALITPGMRSIVLTRGGNLLTLRSAYLRDLKGKRHLVLNRHFCDYEVDLSQLIRL